MNWYTVAFNDVHVGSRSVFFLFILYIFLWNVLSKGFFSTNGGLIPRTTNLETYSKYKTNYTTWLNFPDANW